MFRIAVTTLLICGSAAASANGDTTAFPLAQFKTFTENYCLDCHSDGEDSEGSLDLKTLSTDLSKREVLDRWIHVFERIEDGEMPPKDASQPDVKEIADVVEWLQSRLTEADRKRQREQGRGVIRRLNRAEYETVLSELFKMPLNIRKDLPEDAKSHGFDTVGSALNVSSVQMEAYLRTLDGVLNDATTLYAQPKRRKHRLTYLEETGFMQVYRRGGPFAVRKDGVAIFATEKFSHLNATLTQWTAPHKGRYRIRVSAYALRSDDPVIVSIRAGGTGHAESNHVPHVFLKHLSTTEGDPQVFEWEGWLDQGHYLHVYPTSLRPMRFAGKREFLKQDEYKGAAAVIQWVEVDGPIFEQWPPPSHQALWANVPLRSIAGAKPNNDPIAHLDRPPAKIAKPRLTEVPPNPETGNRMVYDPNKQKRGGERIHKAAGIPDPYHATLSLNPRNPKQDAERLLTKFAGRAFRRPITKEDVEPSVALVRRWLDAGRDFESAMRVGYKAILTSPSFLYHQASFGNGPALSESALAERLAFFLWNGLPDSAAADPSETLRSKVDRMLADDRSNRFLNEFLGLWLDLRLIDFTVPDEKLYPEFDKLLQWSMVEETHSFVRKMIDEDLPIKNIVDSDFAMVNWRLARHYGLPPINGMDVRAIPLPSDSVRGGLLTQGSLLKVTANGTTTSPVVRGVWLMERIMGIEPDPPPPGIPAIEPDIRGATTVRDQLEKHRNSPSCASCHTKIDPPGMALENFDVIGGYRERYRALNENLADLKPKFSPFQKAPVRYIDGFPVDASYEFADGRSFENIEGFRRLLLADERQIARGVVEKLLIYATGAKLSLADRPEVEAILDRSQASEYGFRTLIHEVVQSRLFQSK